MSPRLVESLGSQSDCSRPGSLVGGETNDRLQLRVWNDILEILETENPTVRKIVQDLDVRKVAEDSELG